MLISSMYVLLGLGTCKAQDLLFFIAVRIEKRLTLTGGDTCRKAPVCHCYGSCLVSDERTMQCIKCFQAVCKGPQLHLLLPFTVI